MSTFQLPIRFRDWACVTLAITIRINAEEMTKHERRTAKEAGRSNDERATSRSFLIWSFVISLGVFSFGLCRLADAFLSLFSNPDFVSGQDLAPCSEIRMRL